MLGAIVGDIVGSIYEWRNIKTKDFPLFGSRCSFTDDTVMTCAVAEAVMNGGKREDFIKAMKKYGRMYPNVGYGGNFAQWIFSDEVEPYNSFGNGSAARQMQGIGMAFRRCYTQSPGGAEGSHGNSGRDFSVPLLLWGQQHGKFGEKKTH